jgi:hypothetical protein
VKHEFEAQVAKDRIELLEMLAGRLERLNVDSKWSRRALGTRGGAIKVISSSKEGSPPPPEVIEELIRKSIEILAKAAREIPESNADGAGQADQISDLPPIKGDDK